MQHLKLKSTTSVTILQAEYKNNELKGHSPIGI